MSSNSHLTRWSYSSAALTTNRDHKLFDDAAEENLSSKLALSHRQRYLANPFHSPVRGIDRTFGLDTLYVSSRPFRGINYTFGLDILDASRKLQDLQKNQPSSLERLPTELRTRILEYISDYGSLWSLISASPHYLKAFLAFRNPLLTRITIRELAARGVILCNQMKVSNPRVPQVVSLHAHNIEWLDYKLKTGIEHTLTLQSDLHAALETYYSQIETNSCLSLDVQQLKALRTLEDVVTWLRNDPELQRFRSEFWPSLACKVVDGVPGSCLLVRESTFRCYQDVNNLDVLHNYHSWKKGRRTETEIRHSRAAIAWFARDLVLWQKDLNRLEAFQRYFPWCKIRAGPELINYEDSIRKYFPAISFLCEDSEATILITWGTQNVDP